LMTSWVRRSVSVMGRSGDDTLRPMEALPLVLSGGWAAGVNAYATVLLLGIFGRLGLGEEPDGLERTEVMVAAGALYAIEFVTDKIPYVDHVWDAIHTVIRPTIAAVIGVLLNDQAEGCTTRSPRPDRVRRRSPATASRRACGWRSTCRRTR
jgi:hypothetical protein